MSDRQFAVCGEWALASDGLQWIVQRRYHLRGKPRWRSISFVHSTRAVLARCLREAGASGADVHLLLFGLPATFDAWRPEKRPPPPPIGLAAPPLCVPPFF